jgi:hypothetical protein
MNTRKVTEKGPIIIFEMGRERPLPLGRFS